MLLKRVLLFAFLGGLACTMFSCSSNNGGKSLAEGASGDMDAYVASGVNAVQQALPTIMVLPSDQTLKNFGALTEQRANGRSYIIRDYQKYLNSDDRFRRIISTIQQAFVRQNYPISDFEQSLKQMDTQEALDLVDGLEKDAKTLLLTTAKPDIILELDYNTSRDNRKISMTSHNYNQNTSGEKNVNYTLSAIDAYSNKVLSSSTASNIKGESTTETIQDDIQKQLPQLMTNIQSYFSDILTRGREITVRVTLDKGAGLNLSDASIDGDTYADWIIDYVKTHTVKGAYNMQRNTRSELYFVNCRISLLNEDGTQYGVYDWARDLARNLRRNLGLRVENKAQGLGEVLVTIQGLQ